jgi:hypothetical protein
MKTQPYWFNYTQIKEYKDYFLEHGFCVITNIVEDLEIKEAINEIWEHPSLLGDSGIIRDDPNTWNIEIDGVGFLDLKGGYSHAQLKYYWKTRLNDKIINVYRQLYNEEDLKFKLGRYGFMRPTKNIIIKDGTLIDKPEWKTNKKWVHLDLNPWDHQDLRIQGILTLTDQTETSGGFCCIPDFHKKINEWSKTKIPNAKEKISDLYYFDKEAEEQDMIQKLIVPKGSLILWDRRTPHSNYPNNDNTFRIVEYIHYEPTAQINNTIIQTHIRLGLENRLCSPESFFPHQLTEKQLKLIDYHKHKNVLTTDRQLAGYKKYKKACALETQGEYKEAITLYSSAFKLCPILELI